MRLKPVLIALGIALAIIGLFFALQGSGNLPWPPGGMMVGDPQWVTNGTVIAVVGLVMILVARRLR